MQLLIQGNFCKLNRRWSYDMGDSLHPAVL